MRTIGWWHPGLILIFLFGYTACGEEATVEVVDYRVELTIVSPLSNATYEVNEPFRVEVDYQRSDNQLIHNIKVEIVDADGMTVQRLVERHAHVAGTFTFTSDPLSIATPGVYTVRAETTDLHLEGEGSHDEGAKAENIRTLEFRVE